MEKGGIIVYLLVLGSIALEKQGVDNLLVGKLAHLGLVYIDDEWDYDPRSYLSTFKVKTTHIS